MTRRRSARQRAQAPFDVNRYLTSISAPALPLSNLAAEEQVRTHRTSLLSVVSIAAMFVTSVFSVIRARAVSQAVSSLPGSSSTRPRASTEAAARVDDIAVLFLVLTFLTAVVIAVWTFRVLRRANWLGAPTRPSFSSLMWLVPIVGPQYPLRDLSVAVADNEHAKQALQRWSILLHINVLLVVCLTVGSADVAGVAGLEMSWELARSFSAVTATATWLTFCFGAVAILAVQRTIDSVTLEAVR